MFFNPVAFPLEADFGFECLLRVKSGEVCEPHPHGQFVKPDEIALLVFVAASDKRDDNRDRTAKNHCTAFPLITLMDFRKSWGKLCGVKAHVLPKKPASCEG